MYRLPSHWPTCAWRSAILLPCAARMVIAYGRASNRCKENPPPPHNCNSQKSLTPPKPEASSFRLLPLLFLPIPNPSIHCSLCPFLPFPLSPQFLSFPDTLSP